MDLGKKVSMRLFTMLHLFWTIFLLTEENHEPHFAILYEQLKKVKFYENGLAWIVCGHFCQFAKPKC